MKDNYYTMPEGFLDRVSKEAKHNAAVIRRRRISAVGAFGAVCLFVALNLTSKTSQDLYGLDNLPENEIAEIVELYESDIFLNYNF